MSNAESKQWAKYLRACRQFGVSVAKHLAVRIEGEAHRTQFVSEATTCSPGAVRWGCPRCGRYVASLVATSDPRVLACRECAQAAGQPSSASPSPAPLKSDQTTADEILHRLDSANIWSKP